MMKLNLEELERRDTPATWQTETFDAVALGVLPGGWAQWSSAGTNSFGTSSAQPYAGPNGLTSNSLSNVTSRTWQTNTMPADTSVSSAVFAGTLIPTELIARGQNLASNTPTFYAASVVRGVNVQIIKSIGGTRTVLASLQSISYVSQVWLKVSLVLAGNQIQTEIYNAATGQYLNSARNWQSTQAYALTVTDSSITAAGQIGINRPASYADPVYVDNFAALVPEAPVPPPAPAPAPTEPTIPSHYSHIRIAQLAYSGTPMTSFETGLLQNSVDLVIPNPTFLGPIENISPNTPQLIYTNTSNLYENLFTDWLSYADAKGLDREAAFYHVSQATNFSGSSPSSIPVNWLWSVTNGATDYTGASRSSTTNDVPLGGSVGSSIYFGYPDKFRELNFNISTPAGNGWSGILEFSQGDNWYPFTTITNTTANFTQSGQITFDPPQSWKPTAVAGATRYYYVRLRTVTAGQAPIFSTVLGRDYVNANGNSAGVIPVFDTAADTNGDGYLSNAEYANRASGKDARFRYESRLFYPNYGQMRFATNPASAGIKAWAADWHMRMLRSNPLADGFFVDNSDGRAPLGGAITVESAANYSSDFAQMLKTVSTAIAPHWLMANTSGGNTSTDAVVQAVPASYEEFALRPMSATWSRFNDLAALVQSRLAASNSPFLVLDTHPQGGDPTDPRTQLGALAYYYLLADPVRTFVDFFGGYEPATSWTRHWVPAAAFNVGQPTAGWTEWATGNDPSNTGLTYKVFGRTYSNALVLYKPLSYKAGTGTGILADNTATTHALSRNYRLLKADGTLGPIVTSVTLRNGEGAILIPA
ncbi:MAG: hypothetical protein ACJ8C4_05955 [Gemmataceae bacterium]